MSRQEANAAFARSSFLYGGNAEYIEDLQARFEDDPGSVEAGWQEFFRALKDERASVERAAHGPSWQRRGWPVPAGGELLAALSGDWQEVHKRVEEKIGARAQALGIE